MNVPARYHKHRDRVVSGVDKLFAENVSLAFLKDGAVDPDREATIIEAVLRVGATDVSGLDGGSNKSWASRIAANKAELHIDPRKYPELNLKTGDKVRAITRDGKPWFEVLTPATRGHSRLIYSLGVA